MNEGEDTQGCARFAEALLPLRAAEGEAGAPPELLRHLAACPACSALLAGRAAIGAAIAALPRHRSPALEFSTIAAQLDVDAFERELARGDTATARRFAGVVRTPAPASLTYEAIFAQVEPAARPLVRWTALRRIASCAAAALVALSLWPLLQGAPAPTGLAAETAALSDRPSLVVRVVHLDAAGTERGLAPPAAPLVPGRAWLPVRGGP